MNLVIAAREIAIAAHSGQLDKVGEPYIYHPAWVAHEVQVAGFGEEVQAAAWLHDVVEDTDVTLDDLREKGFPESVVEAVDALSKRKGEKFEPYYERVKANDIAIAVKWFDVKHNSLPERLGRVTPHTQDRLRGKYERARTFLVPAYEAQEGSHVPGTTG